jgi:hypothetical protein
VDGVHAVTPLTQGDLVALISEVQLDEFGSEPLKRNLEDLAWLERTALAHNAVLARARSADAVVPFRTCTIYADRARVAEMLESERSYFHDVLDRLRHRDEWSVKMLADRQRVEASVRDRRPAAAVATAASEEPQTPGRAFFVRKKTDRSVTEEASAVVRTAARQAHDRLREHASAAVLLPPQDPRVSGRTGDMALNGAYLVDRSAVDEFAATVDTIRRGECPDGVELIVSGPFAPYSFVPAREER